MANNRMRYEDADSLIGQANAHEALAECFTKLYEYELTMQEQGELNEDDWEGYTMYVRLLEAWETTALRYVEDRLRKAVRIEKEKKENAKAKAGLVGKGNPADIRGGAS